MYEPTRKTWPDPIVVALSSPKPFNHRTMRLSAFERQTLKQAALSSFGPGVVLRLFGSRVADGQRGGDIDLLVETQLLDPAKIAQAHTRFLARVYSHLGEQM